MNSRPWGYEPQLRACIAEGALAEGVAGEPGYVGYVCGTEAQAKRHVLSIRDRLTSTEVARHYPGLANPRFDTHGNRLGWRQDFLMTASGWGIVPDGLDQDIRGGRLLDLRFSMLVFDDIDSRKVSAALADKKLETIAYDILPAGTPDTLKLFPQNLVHEDSVMNQVYTRRSDVLSERRVSSPVKAFEELELEPDDEQPGKFMIKSAVPTWTGLDMRAARVLLADSGRAAFLAEYQHDLEGDESEFVLKNWDDAVHVITWSEFERVYAVRSTPRLWAKTVFNDWARTRSERHANVAGMVAVSAQNEPLPGFVFLFHCMSFPAGTEADDVALRILEAISPTVSVNGSVLTWDEVLEANLTRRGVERFVPSVTRQIEARRDTLARIIPPLVQPILQAQKFTRFRGSHEQANGALRVYHLYGLPFRPTNPGSDGGIELLNHMMRVDYDSPHPFKEGAKGFSRFFLIVDDHKAAQPRGTNPALLEDSDLARFQFRRWRNAPLRVTEAGVAERPAAKFYDDFGQGLQMCFHDGLPPAAPLTPAERADAERPPNLRSSVVARIQNQEQASVAIMGQMGWYFRGMTF